MWKSSVAALTALLCAFATSSTDAYRPGDEVCTLSSANQCAVDALKPSALDGSVLIYPGGKTRCAFDDFTDPSGNFKSNKTYFFQVFPNKQPQQAKKKVLLYFQGGGGCTDADTCSFSIQCSLGKSSTFTTYASAYSTGVFNRTNPDNLFKDWDIIHVPYCTGDLHAGNVVHEPVDSVFASFLGQPQCLGQKMKTYMSGYENSMAVLKWALANYPNPEHLIIGGASAGSLAAQAMSVLVADMWKVKDSSIRYSVLADSYFGAFPEETKPSSAVLDFFGICDVDLKAPATVVSACKAKTMTTVELFTALIKEVPFANWLLIDSKADRTQRTFYQLMKDGILGYPFANIVTAEAFFKQATSMVASYRTVSSRISTYFVEGEKHVFTLFEGYANTVSDTGEKLGEFLSKWLVSSNNSTVSPTPTPTTTPVVPGPSPVPAPTTTAQPTPSVRPGC